MWSMHLKEEGVLKRTTIKKDDGEFADLDFSYFNQEGKEVFVTCPESASVLQTDS